VFDDPHQVLEERLPLLVGDDSCSDVTEDVRATRLNGVQITAVV